MFEHGYANSEFGYWGNFVLVDTRFGKNSGDDRNAVKTAVMAAVSENGIDWDKTNEPCIDIGHEFDGTGRDSRHVKYVCGKLYLKNGCEIQWCMDDVDQFNQVRAYINGTHQHIPGLVMAAVSKNFPILK